MDEPGMVALRPVPAVEPHTEPFWEAVREHRLVLPRCTSCGALQFPPELACTHCGAPERIWESASGRATLYTWTVCHPPLLPYFSEHAPWAVAVVELEEGVRMVARITGLDVDDYRIGIPLVADFEDVDDTHTLVVFRPA